MATKPIRRRSGSFPHFVLACGRPHHCKNFSLIHKAGQHESTASKSLPHSRVAPPIRVKGANSFPLDICRSRALSNSSTCVIKDTR